jgi:hypothetical protein
LRIPIGAAAVQEPRLRLLDDLTPFDRLAALRRHRDRLVAEILRVEPAAVGDVERHLLIPLDRLRQADEHRRLAQHARGEQTAQAGRRDRRHGERLGQPERDALHGVRAHANSDAPAPADPGAPRVERDVEPVLDHVVRGAGVLVVEAPPLGDLRRRGVQREVVAACAVEQRDVLGVVDRACVCEPPIPRRFELDRHTAGDRQDRPTVRTEVAQIEAEAPR